MSTDNIFDGNKDPQETLAQKGVEQNTTSQNNDAPFADLLSGIRNESGVQKYKDVPEALNGLKHAQEYIPTLTAQLREREAEIEKLRQEAQRAMELENVVKELTQRVDSMGTNQPNPITPEEIAEHVNRVYSQNKEQEAYKNNVNTVVTAIQKAFGDKAEEVFYNKAAELGFTKDEINDLAGRKPQAIFGMFGIKEQPVQRSGTLAPTQTVVNTAAFEPTKESLVGRNRETVTIGATSQELGAEFQRAKRMVEELHEQGYSVHDLTDPKVFFKQFG